MGCKPSHDIELSDYIDHWEISRTFSTYNNSKIEIDTIANEYEVASGYNQVLIIITEKKPIFKEGKELTDLYSTKTLLIELDSIDNLVTAETPGNSRLFRQLIAFSPDYGIKPLDKEEEIKLTRKDSTTWTIYSEIHDFIFNCQLDFKTNQTLTDKFNDY